jgi:hypothetical protein
MCAYILGNFLLLFPYIEVKLNQILLSVNERKKAKMNILCSFERQTNYLQKRSPFSSICLTKLKCWKIETPFSVCLTSHFNTGYFDQRFLNTLDSTFSINWGENWNFLSMLDLSRIQVNTLSQSLCSNITYNITFHSVCCWCMLLWVVSSVFRNRWFR